MSNVIYKRCKAGFNGAVSREANSVREARLLNEGAAPADYGFPVKMLPDGTISALAAGDAATDVFGFLVRPYPTTETGVPKEGYMQDVLLNGYVTVKVVSGTVVAKGPVYILTTATPDHEIGEISADAAAGAVVVPDAYFTGPSENDEDGELIGEIAYKVY